MKVTKKEQSKDKLEVSFSVEDADVAYLNTVRRAVMDYVPTLAIEDVAFNMNTSVLYDEIVAHRLGLIPIETEPGTYNFRVDGESSVGSELKITLKAKGPGVVYAEQMKGAKTPCGKIPITKLLKEQEIEFEAIAILGRGVEHAKWSPGIMYYEYSTQVKVNAKAPELDKHISRFPPEVVEGGKINKDKIIKLGLAQACEGIYPEAVEITHDPSVLHVTVESWGQLDAVTMVKEACTYIAGALDELAEATKALK